MMLQAGTSGEARWQTDVSWDYYPPLVIGASFGASVALVALAQDPRFAGGIAVSPVVDFRSHNRDQKEEDLRRLEEVLLATYAKLWRTDRRDIVRLREGEADVSPLKYETALIERNILLIHASGDSQVSFSKSKAFIDRLTVHGSHAQLIEVDDGDHLGLRHLGDEQLAKAVCTWLETNRKETSV